MLEMLRKRKTACLFSTINFLDTDLAKVVKIFLVEDRDLYILHIQ